MARRLSSIRARTTLLVLVPLLALVALWALLTAITFGDAVNLVRGQTFQNEGLTPTQNIVIALQKERRLSLVELGDPRTANSGAMRNQRQATDQAREVLQANLRRDSLRDVSQRRVLQRLDALVTALGTLDEIRRGVDQRVTDRARALREYSELVDACYAVYTAATPQDGSITSDARTLTAISRSREYLAREDALLSGALAAGRLTAAERGEFAQLVGTQRNLFIDSTRDLYESDLVEYRRITSSPEYARLRALENQVVRGGADRTATPARQNNGTAGGPRTSSARALPVDAASWRALSDTVNARLFAFEDRVLDHIVGHARGIAMGVFVRLAAAGGLGLVAVLLSTFIAVRVSRRLLRECRTLAAGVVDFTRERLPMLARQAREGRPMDVGELPGYDYRIDEIKQIADSFDRAREAVLVAAAGEIAARRGISEVFVNLARRNQALVHRQLSLLDTMERRTEDPAELSDLFRLDHLATRMRRHAEGLVILAGKSAGRGWRRPVPLVDVVRGAVAEVEDYPRVRVQPLPRVALLGSAVADVIHLLAEIVENATTFSPPQSPVRVSGHPVSNGFALEIEDRGLGMTPEDLRAANERLAHPPEFDPSDSAQLGLFVVARLAERHEIKVTLRPSPYGGTTAIALIPGTLLVEDAEPDQPARRTTGPLPLAQAQPPAAVAAPAAPAVEAPVRLVEAAPEPAAGAAADGDLPKRRRQTHLAPQLKARVDAHLAARGLPVPAEPAAGDPAPAEPLAAPVPAEPLGAPVPAGPLGASVPGPAGPGGDDRSPETMRTKLSAMQRGWERARTDAPPPDAEHGEALRNRGDQEDDTP